MSDKLSCEIVRDLLPSYADGQTSEKTNQAVEAHLSGCRECSEILRRMREPEKAAVSEKEEIDYLKKVKRSKRAAAWITAAAVLVVSLLAAGLWSFFHGSKADLNSQAADIEVNGNVVSVRGSLVSSGEGVARLVFTEENGVVDVQLYTTLILPGKSGSFSKTYTARADTVRAVTSNGIVLWEDGTEISGLAGRLYASKNPYIGNMPANQRIANVIGLRERYGNYQNELQTAKEPYGWTIVLNEPALLQQEEKIREKMREDACLMIASVENLSQVTWRYENGTGVQEYTVTKEEASKIAGADIKSFAASAAGMQKLIEIVK